MSVLQCMSDGYVNMSATPLAWQLLCCSALHLKKQKRTTEIAPIATVAELCTADRLRTLELCLLARYVSPADWRFRWETTEASHRKRQPALTSAMYTLLKVTANRPCVALRSH